MKHDINETKVVLIHGFSMSKNVFPYQKKIEGIETYAIDLPGHGDNKNATSGTSTKFAQAVQKELGSKQEYVLCGHSMGASVALEYQRLFPNEAKGLILVDTAAKFLQSYDYPIGTPKEVVKEAVARLQRDRSEFYKGFIPAMFNEAPNEKIANMLLTEMEKADPEVVLNSLRSFSAMDYRDFLSQIRVPVMVMHGKHDHLYPVAAAEDMQERIPGAKLVVFENSGHCPHIEEPKKFNCELNDFVEGIGGKEK